MLEISFSRDQKNRTSSTFPQGISSPTVSKNGFIQVSLYKK
jgi:hypothetical protein